MRHRPLHGDRAPSGLLLDVAKIESVEPAERRSEPDIPPVMPHVPSPAPVHRKVVEHSASAAQLMSSDMEVAFPDAPPREPELGSVAISWTAEGGFTESGSPSRMRLVGQRGEFEDVAGLTDDDDATESGPSLRYLPVAGPRHEQAPRDLVDIVEEATGVRVSDALIDRSPEISDRASSIGAIAFTERGTVHLPAELGDLSEPHNRAIVAHELTHVAQQRSIGRVPAEDSPEGRQLEDEARQVQRRVGGTVRPHFMRRRTGSARYRRRRAAPRRRRRWPVRMAGPRLVAVGGPRTRTIREQFDLGRLRIAGRPEPSVPRTATRDRRRGRELGAPVRGGTQEPRSRRNATSATTRCSRKDCATSVKRPSSRSANRSR